VIRLKGYAPDADPSLEGVLTNCSAVVPTLRGFKGAPAVASTGIQSLAGTCQGAAVLMKMDNSTRFFAGTGKQLYEVAGTAWTNVSRASTYTASNVVRWRFAQFGDVSLAANANDTIQASTGTAFADISGAPAASIIETVGQFVFAFNTIDATYGASPDRWRCSALGDYTSWTPSIATQAASGRLVATQGPITAAKKFGDAIVVLKQYSCYLGTYQGPPVLWSFTQIPGQAGALSQESVVNIGTPEDPRLIFMGSDDFYEFNGTHPVPIGETWLKQQVYGEMLQSRYYTCYAQHDRVKSLVYFYYPVADQVNPDHCVVYNYKSKRWGRDDRTIEAAIEYVAPGITYGALGNSYATYADLPSQTYGYAFLSTALPVPGVIDVNHTVKTLTGAAVTSSITTGDLGDDEQFVTLTRVRPRFITAPTSASLVNYYRNNTGDSLTTDATTSLSNGKFDVLRDAQWHRFRMDFVGDWEMAAYLPEFEKAGSA
jgi:hypothetical protein